MARDKLLARCQPACPSRNSLAVSRALPAKPGVYIFKNAKGDIIYVGKAAVLRNRVRSYFGATHAFETKTRQPCRADRRHRVHPDGDGAGGAAARGHPGQAPPAVLQRPPQGRQALPLPEDRPARAVAPRRDHAAGRDRTASATSGRSPPPAPCARSSTWSRSSSPGAPAPRRSPAKTRAPAWSISSTAASAPAPRSARRRSTTASSARRSCSSKAAPTRSPATSAARWQTPPTTWSSSVRPASATRSQAIERTTERQVMEVRDRTDMDVFGLAREEQEAWVQVFFLRKGLIIGRDIFQLDGTLGETDAEVLRSFVEQFYESAPFVPARVVLPVKIDDADLIQQWLGERRGAARTGHGAPARRKTAAAPARHGQRPRITAQARARWMADRGKKDEALHQLQDELNLPALPRRIECYDISNIQGTSAVGSMVVFEDGNPKRSEYRRFRIKGVGQPERLRDDAGGPQAPLLARPPRRPSRKAPTRPTRWNRRRPRDRPRGRRERARRSQRRRSRMDRTRRESARRLAVTKEHARARRLVRQDAGPADRRRRQGPGLRRPRRHAQPRRRPDPAGRARQAVRGALRQRRQRADRPRPHLAGALPRPAHPRRGPPLRHHLPPRRPLQVRRSARRWTKCPASAPSARRRCSASSAPSRAIKDATVEEIAATPGFTRAVAEKVLEAL